MDQSPIVEPAAKVQSVQQKVQEVAPEHNQRQQLHHPVIRSEMFTNSNLAKTAIDPRENIRRRQFYHRSRCTNAPPSAFGRSSMGDHGRVSGSSDSGSRQSRSYTEIRKAVSILKDMEKGLWIRCSNASCQASVTATTSYKCPQCNFDHWVQLGRRISRGTDITICEPNPWFKGKEFKIPK